MREPYIVDFDLPPAGLTLRLLGDASGEGKYIKETSGHRRYGHLRVVIAPFAGDCAYRFAWDIPDGMLPLSFMQTAALEGVKDTLMQPVHGGGRVAHVCVSVVDGSYHDTETTDVAVRIAASMAVMSALSRAALARE